MNTPPVSFLGEVMGLDGQIEPGLLVHVLRITKTELAIASGLSRDAVFKSSRLKARATQTRLRDVAEIISRVLPWAGSVPQAARKRRSAGMRSP